MARKSGFKYEYVRRSPEEMQKERDAGGDRFDRLIKAGFKQYKHKESNRLRILPPPTGTKLHWAEKIPVHYGVGPDKAAYVCVLEFNRQPCPICEERRRETDEAVAKEYRATVRMASWVIDRDNEDEGPQIAFLAFSLEREITKLSADKRTGEVLWIDDPEEGYDIEYERTGTGIRTKYEGVQIARRSSPLCDDPDTADDWLRYVSDNPIRDCIQTYDYDHLSDVFSGSVGIEDKDADEESERPSRKRHDSSDDDDKPARRMSSRKRDEETMSWDDDEVDTKSKDDDDVRPKSRRSRIEDEETESPRRKSRIIEDDDNELEEEETPRPRKRARSEPEDVDEDDDKEESVQERVRRRLRK